MKVEQLMTKDVAACRAEDTLNDAARIMWERDCGFVPVLESGGGGRVAGIVTDRDVCMASYTRGQPLGQIAVRDVMSAPVRTCRPTETLAVAETAMRQAQVHRLPVVDEADQLLGVISLADIARAAARESAAKRRRVTPAEIGQTLAAIRQPRKAPPPPA